jgi:hypothetical protein
MALSYEELTKEISGFVAEHGDDPKLSKAVSVLRDAETALKDAGPDYHSDRETPGMAAAKRGAPVGAEKEQARAGAAFDSQLKKKVEERFGATSSRQPSPFEKRMKRGKSAA